MSTSNAAHRSKHGFDYIVVGAGAAGCVIANRLSADPACRVALVEAGPSDRKFPVNWKTTLPIGNIFLLPHARYNWQHVFEGGAGANDRQIACPRGKLLGGCTSVNGTVYIRGHRRDYDDWEAHGNDGWGYARRAAVLQAPREPRRRAVAAARPRRRARRAAAGARATRSRMPSSPPPVRPATRRTTTSTAPTQEGFGLFELNQRHGVRLSSSRAFLHPVLRRGPT